MMSVVAPETPEDAVRSVPLRRGSSAGVGSGGGSGHGCAPSQARPALREHFTSCLAGGQSPCKAGTCSCETWSSLRCRRSCRADAEH